MCTSCAANYYVKTKVCTACESGFIIAAGGINTGAGKVYVASYAFCF